MNVVEMLEQRGFIDSVSNRERLIETLSKPTSVYVGFDPTADSLHLGNLIAVIALAWFQKYGHTPIILLGGGTGKIGDPSGKSLERPLLSYEAIDKNVENITRHFEKWLDFSGTYPKPQIVNNDHWLSQYELIPFLRDVGKHFRMGTMLGKESVRARLNTDEGMSFTEFTYQVLQGYDFYYLHGKHNVRVQLGGSDQWGNITAGIELTRRCAHKEVFGVTFPLLTRSDGKKFGKSEDGAIWLNKDKCSPYALYQHLFRIPDADVIRMLKMLTFFPLEEIEEYERTQNQMPPNTLQQKLAEEVTRFVHGEKGVELAQRVTQALAPGSTAPLDGEVFQGIIDEIPHRDVSKQEVLGKGYPELAVVAGVVGSKGEGVRLFKNGGAYINNQKIAASSYKLCEGDLIDDRFVLVNAGKKKKSVLRIVG